jgi:GxxExxY protein
MSEMIKDTLTEKIISCAFKVHSTLRPGFREINYHNALIIALHDIGLKYDSERTFRASFYE